MCPNTYSNAVLSLANKEIEKNILAVFSRYYDGMDPISPGLRSIFEPRVSKHSGKPYELTPPPSPVLLWIYSAYDGFICFHKLLSF